MAAQEIARHQNVMIEYDADLLPAAWAVVYEDPVTGERAVQGQRMTRMQLAWVRIVVDRADDLAGSS